MLKIPYNEWEMKLAFNTVTEEMVKKTEELVPEFQKRMPEEKAEQNKMVAEANGITVEQLINSPNYKVLTEEYHERIIKDLVTAFVDKAGFTDKQAWAMISMIMGWI